MESVYFHLLSGLVNSTDEWFLFFVLSILVPKRREKREVDLYYPVTYGLGGPGVLGFGANANPITAAASYSQSRRHPEVAFA